MRNAYGDPARGAPSGEHAGRGAVGGRAKRRARPGEVHRGGQRMSRVDVNTPATAEAPTQIRANAGIAGRSIDRRSVLKGGAALVFALGTGGGLSILPIRSADAQSRWAAARSIDPDRLDTWIAVAESGDVTAFFGKMDMGQGVDTAIAQVVAEELDVDAERVEVVMGDRHLTPDQGGASGSSGCRQGSIPLRNAAAEARRVFVERASERLGVPVARLRTRAGGVYVADDPGTSVTYGDLIAEGFERELDWNGQYGNGLLVQGEAARKAPREYRVVG